MAQIIAVIHSRWSILFDEFKFSTDEFYASVESRIKRKQIENVSCKRITLNEGGLFAGKREYLRIKKNGVAYDVCAAPYGTGFFISYWHGEIVGGIREMTSRIPIVGPLMAKARTLKTYYQHDTEGMFKLSVQNAIQEAVESISKAKGLRQLSPIEMKPTESVPA